MSEENRPGDTFARHHQLLEILRSASPPESECQSYLPRLDAYIAAQLAGEDYLTRYADIALHLDRCERCADSYARLYELELALAAGELPAPQLMPAPDLSFLSTPKTQGGNSLLDLLADALRSTTNNIRLHLTEELLALLQPHQPAALTRSSVDDARYGEVLYELQPEQLPAPTMPIRLTAYRDSLQPEQCLLEVVAMPPGVNWPNLAGYTVTLQIGDEQVTQTTDAWGVVAFAGIPITRLREVALHVDLAR
jgi:hypothetical protein